MISFKYFVYSLVENRVQFIKDNTKEIDSSHDTLAQHRDPHDIIDHFSTHSDPTEKKEYLQWIINRYKAKDFRQEDAGRVKDALTKFHLNKRNPALQRNDINQHRSLASVEDAVSTLDPSQKSKNQLQKQAKIEGADEIHSGNGVTVHHIKTENAAKLYGAGTRWCTAADSGSMFNSYHSKGPIFVIQHKGRKYQFHNESNQFMEENDKPVSLSSLHPDVQEELFKIDHPEVKKLIAEKGNDNHINRLMENGNLNPKKDAEVFSSIIGKCSREVRKNISDKFGKDLNEEQRNKLNRMDLHDKNIDYFIKNRGVGELDSEKEAENREDISHVGYEGNSHHAHRILQSGLLPKSDNKFYTLKKSLIEKIKFGGNPTHMSALAHLNPDELDSEDIHDLFLSGNDETRDTLLRNHPDMVNDAEIQKAIAATGADHHIHHLLDNSNGIESQTLKHIIKSKNQGFISKIIDSPKIISATSTPYDFDGRHSRDIINHLVKHSDESNHEKIINHYFGKVPEPNSAFDQMSTNQLHNLISVSSKRNRDLFASHMNSPEWDWSKKPEFDGLHDINKETNEDFKKTMDHADLLESGQKLSASHIDDILDHSIGTRNDHHLGILADRHYDSLTDEHKKAILKNMSDTKKQSKLIKSMIGDKKLSDDMKTEIIKKESHPDYVDFTNSLTKKHGLTEEHINSLSENLYTRAQKSEEQKKVDDTFGSLLNNKNTSRYSLYNISRGTKNKNHLSKILSLLKDSKDNHDGESENSNKVDTDNDDTSLFNMASKLLRRHHIKNDQFGASIINSVAKKAYSFENENDRNEIYSNIINNHMHRIRPQTSSLIAKNGNQEHIEKISNNSTLLSDPETQIAVARHGNENSIKNLLNQETLHPDAITGIISKNETSNPEHLTKLLDLQDSGKIKLNNYHMFTIAKKGNDEHRRRILNNENVSDEALVNIVHGAEDKTLIDKVMERKNLHQYVHAAIAQSGTEEHHQKLLDDHLDPNNFQHLQMSYPQLAMHSTNRVRSQILDHLEKSYPEKRKEMGDVLSVVHEKTLTPIVKYGTDEHRDRISKYSNLTNDTKDAMAQEGNQEHLKSLLDRPTLSPNAIAKIAVRGNDEVRSKLLKRKGPSDLAHPALKAIAEGGNEEHHEQILNSWEAGNEPHPSVVKAMIEKGSPRINKMITRKQVYGSIHGPKKPSGESPA